MGAFMKPCLSKMILTLGLLLTPVIQGLNLGLIAGDLKRHSSPLIIKKVSKLSPVFININSRSKTPLTLPKLPPKPPPLKLLEPTKLSRKLPRSILSPKLPLHPPILPLLLPILPPILPPFLPILPPLLPIIPKISLLPILPHLPLSLPQPLLPKLKSPLNPLRVPIIKRSSLKPLETELKKIKVPPVKKSIKDGILDKLLDLKKKGSLTTAEFLKFKKLLLK